MHIICADYSRSGALEISVKSPGFGYLIPTTIVPSDGEFSWISRANANVPHWADSALSIADAVSYLWNFATCVGHGYTRRRNYTPTVTADLERFHDGLSTNK